MRQERAAAAGRRRAAPTAVSVPTPRQLIDIARIYRSWRHGAYHRPDEASPLASGPSVPFTDYVGWLAKRDPAGARAYWQERLSGLDAKTPLPTSVVARQQADGSNPGAGYIRLALVADSESTAEALHRLVETLK